LHPGEFESSYAYGTNGTQQVGYGWSWTTGDHALLWNGTAASYVDLHQFLPAGFIYSDAMGIDGYGNIVGYAQNSSGYTHAILWEPVPEPATFFLLGLGAVMLRKRKK
jgi:probable HAF family extracellular repeat protein